MSEEEPTLAYDLSTKIMRKTTKPNWNNARARTECREAPLPINLLPKQTSPSGDLWNSLRDLFVPEVELIETKLDEGEYDWILSGARLEVDRPNGLSLDDLFALASYLLTRTDRWEFIIVLIGREIWSRWQCNQIETLHLSVDSQESSLPWRSILAVQIMMASKFHL